MKGVTGIGTIASILFPLALVAGCGIQPVNHGAATPVPGRDPNAPPTTAILSSARPIELDPEDESATTADPCEKTLRDKTDILTAYCARCHSGPAAQAQGLPPWNFVLDDKRLISEQFTREQQPPQRYVIPGDPMGSVLYVRAVVLRDMPPQPTDLGTPRNPAPTLSDASVLRDWIEHCLPGAPPRQPPSGGDDDGGDDNKADAGDDPATTTPPAMPHPAADGGTDAASDAATNPPATDGGASNVPTDGPAGEVQDARRRRG
ncbi:MAG TPA: hypothetical protein VNO55_27510 [Polyangia bacterium]|nr:hypothetical protein [Polyangia bacterium]